MIGVWTRDPESSSIAEEVNYLPIFSKLPVRERYLAYSSMYVNNYRQSLHNTTRVVRAGVFYKLEHFISIRA